MLILLTAAAFLAGSPASGDSHHGFRLPVDIAVHSESRCPPSRGVTVCANRADAHLRWRAVADERAPDRAGGPHIRSLRVQPARCANPVEDGLRCVKPLAFARINLDD